MDDYCTPNERRVLDELRAKYDGVSLEQEMELLCNLFEWGPATPEEVECIRTPI